MLITMTNESNFRVYLKMFNYIPVFCLHYYIPIEKYKAKNEIVIIS